MNAVVRATALLVLLATALPPLGHAYELEPGLNEAGVINFPTALNQPTTHTLYAALELTDVAEPDLNLYAVRYGLQLGALQLIADANYLIEPVHEFNYLEVKAKLQVLSLDEYRSYLAVGILGRAVEKADERKARIDDHTASLFGISTFELFPFEQWGGMLINAYVDNRFAVLGLKLQIYQSIKAVAELERLHSTEYRDDGNGRVGVSFEGLQNTYFQLFWSDQGEHWLVQLGTGF